MCPPYLFLLLVSAGELERDGIVWPVGLFIFLTGLSIRVWSQTHLHYRLRVRKCLTMTGPYALVRNPIYIANTIMLLGITVLSELLWFLPVMLIWCALVYSIVVRKEEAHLAEKYGQPYRDFLNAIPRWFPRFPLHHLRKTHGVLKEYLMPSVVAEAHNLVLLLPLIGKELLSRRS
jgi:protein-S-isoprenylcysteine O-methyltransferase Ste14